MLSYKPFNFWSLVSIDGYKHWKQRCKIKVLRETAFSHTSKVPDSKGVCTFDCLVCMDRLTGH